MSVFMAFCRGIFALVRKLYYFGKIQELYKFILIYLNIISLLLLNKNIDFSIFGTKSTEIVQIFGEFKFIERNCERTIDCDELKFCRDIEILLEILKYLPLRDRKNARLVCTQWFRVSCLKTFAKSEAFFISNVYNPHSIIKMVKRSGRETFDLKFEFRHFEKHSSFLWKKCGNKITSLQFYKCKFSSIVIKQIFTFCFNLSEFSAHSCEIVDLSPLRSNQISESIFQTKKPLLRENLITLHLDSPSIPLTKHDLRIIGASFPKLKSLKLIVSIDHHAPINDEELAQNVFFLFNMLKIVELKHIETLHLQFCKYFIELNQTVNFSSMCNLDLNRLKNVAICLNPFILNEENLNAILRYKFWTSFELDWSGVVAGAVDIAALYRLFEESPLLEHFKLSWMPTNVEDFVILSTALIRSSLKSLDVHILDGTRSLIFSKNLVWEASLILNTLTSNFSVRKLSVTAKRSAEFGSFFIRYFGNVTELFLEPGNPNIVFEHQENLKMLTIFPFNVDRATPVSAKTSIESLEFLSTGAITLDVLSTFRFPNLKYLVIEDTKRFFSRQVGIAADLDDLLLVPNIGDQMEVEDILFGPADDGLAPANTLGAEQINTKIFIEKFNTLVFHVFRKSPFLQGIEIRSDTPSLNIEALEVLFQSCHYFYSLRYVSFYNSSMLAPSVKREHVKQEIVKHLRKQCPSLKAVWVETLKLNVYFFRDVMKKYFQFSDQCTNVSSHCQFNGIELTTFWRNER